MSHAIKIRTTNTASGNPRRGFIITDSSDNTRKFVDIGYRSDQQALNEDGYGHIPIMGPDITVGPGEFKTWKNLGKPVKAKKRRASPYVY